MIALARRYLPETPPRTGAFDLVGAMLATLGMGALVFGMIESADAGGVPMTVVPVALVGAVLLAALVVNEARAAQPIMPLRLFAQPASDRGATSPACSTSAR